MKIMLTVVLAACALLSGCASDTPNPSGPHPRAGDGTSPATAVRIHSFDDIEMNRMMARWVKTNYPQFSIVDQMIVEEHGNTYNVVSIAGPNQTTKRLYFDISMYARRASGPTSPSTR